LNWLDAITPPLDRHVSRLAAQVEEFLARTSRMPSAAGDVAPATPVREPSADAPRAFAAPAATHAVPGWFGALAGLVAPVFSLVAGLLTQEPSGAATPPPPLEEPEPTLSAALTEQLSASRLEDLAGRRVPRALRAPLAAIDANLPGTIDRVVRQADQALTLQDPGRRIEVIEAALRLLNGVQSILLPQSGPLIAAIAGIAAEWTTLFAAARDAAQAALEDAREVENPFIVGNPVHVRDFGLFTGRRDLVLEIERNILRAAQTPTLLLYGQRRMGKTSILNQLPTLLGPGFLPVLVDCQAPAVPESPASLLRYLSRCLSTALNTRLGIVHDDEATRSTRGGVPLPLDVLRKDAFSVFEDWLDEFQTRLPADTHLLLCLDEFERLQETVAAGWGTRFLDGLRHWLQHRPRFALMFIGSHTFEQLGSVWTDRFLSARRLKVSFLGEADVRKLLTHPTPSFGLTYAPGALEAILQATHGQPFLTQVLASELVHHMNRARRKEATTGDVETAIDEALERSGEYFADLWFSRTDAEREVLREAVRGRTQPPVTLVARALREYDVLDDHGEFAVPLVRRWVAQHQLHAGIALG
jgi:hypothetical protein